MNGAHYAYLNTRVSMLAARLLTPRRLEDLVEQGETDYGGIPGLERVDELVDRAGGSTVHIEQVLLTRLLNDFLIVARPVWGANRAFLLYGSHWFELANLKALFRGKFAGLSDAAIRAHLVDTAPFTTLPVDELLTTEDPAEMLRRLETTPYGDIARQARQAYEEHKDLFSLDATIDRRYFVGLYRHAQRVDEDQREPTRELVGHILDWFNILWLLRYRLAYGLSSAETYFLLMPFGRHLSANTLLSLAQLGTLEEVLAGLPEPLRQAVSGSTTVTQVEARLEVRAAGQLEKALADRRHVIARAFAFLVLREFEMRRLLAVVKGRNLGFDKNLIRRAAGIEVH